MNLDLRISLSVDGSCSRLKFSRLVNKELLRVTSVDLQLFLNVDGLMHSKLFKVLAEQLLLPFHRTDLRYDLVDG